MKKQQQGRKALIVLSDGVDHGSKVSVDHAIEAAQRSDTMVYSILFKDEEHESNFGGFGGMGRRGGRYPQEQRPDGKKILERISKETGGRLFEISKKEPVNEIYNQIAEELHYQYELGYTPDRTDVSGYHKIQLTMKKKELEVQAREGYYADSPITASSPDGALIQGSQQSALSIRPAKQLAFLIAILTSQVRFLRHPRTKW